MQEPVDNLDYYKISLQKFDCTLCRYNFGKNLEKVKYFAKINDPEIETFLEQNPFKSFIDFEDK